METSAPVSEARERLLRTATDLFYREGIHSVGVDRILAEAGVTRATMYRHFKGKEDLVEAYLAAEDQTIRGYFAAAESAGGDADMLELVIDGIADDITRYHTRGCPFINAAAEYPRPGQPYPAAHRRTPRLVSRRPRGGRRRARQPCGDRLVAGLAARRRTGRGLSGWGRAYQTRVHAYCQAGGGATTGTPRLPQV